MLRSSDIEVNRHPVLKEFLIGKFFIIMRVNIS